MNGVSVIIPVYNAARFVAEAVQSALAQPETAEVLLIEDGSSDSSLDVCTRLAATDSRIRVLRHPDAQNRGAGASRNLGLAESRCDLIAFLDADDLVLPNRFELALARLSAQPDADGIVEAVGVMFQNPVDQARWQSRAYHPDLITLTREISPERLLPCFASGLFGSLHLNGLLIRRRLLDQTGLFDEDLRQTQDVVFLIKAMAAGRLITGHLDQAVALLRIHDANRVSGQPTPPAALIQRSRQRSEALERWARSCLAPDKRRWMQLFNARRDFEAAHPADRLIWLKKRWLYLRFAVTHPSVLRSRLFWQMIAAPLWRASP